MTAEGLKVLLVDDNSMNRKVFTMLLKSMGSIVDEAASGAECLELAAQNKYDVIFMDHMMPEMDGMETLAKMNQMAESLNKDTPVIALSANPAEEVQDEYLSAGFSGYLEKPVFPPMLQKLISELQ